MPQDPYAVSKWEAEQGLLAIAEETGLEVAKWYQKAGELIS